MYFTKVRKIYSQIAFVQLCGIALNDNYLFVTLYRTHLQILLAYLNCVTGKLSMDNPNIQYLIQNRYLID